MFWRVTLCVFFMISTGSSNIEFTKTLQINYKDNESLQVTVKFQNPVNYVKNAVIKYASTIATCKLDSGGQRHLSFNLSKLIYNETEVIVNFNDNNNNKIQSKILIQLIYNPKRSKEPHECLVHCIINFDIENVLHDSQSTQEGKQNEEYVKYNVNTNFIETEKSNNRQTGLPRVIKLFPDISTYYYFPNTSLTLTCYASNFPLGNSSLVLYKDYMNKNYTKIILSRTLKKTLEYNLDLKEENNYFSLFCAKEEYKSNNIILQLNETYIGSTTITEDNEDIKKYLAYALEALLAVIGILLLSNILLCWRKSRAAHSATPENDVYTYATSQLTYAQLQLNAHEGRNRQVTRNVPYATIVGVLKPKT